MNKIILLLSRYWRTSITVAMVLLILTNPAFAAQGDGSGGGQDAALALVVSTPADGAKDVPLDSRIKLTFNKNVVNMSVQANNRTCFTLAAGQESVAFDVVMADDQVQPEGKRDIILVPKNSLRSGTAYTLTISSRLQAKSGSVMKNAATITFTTVDVSKTEKDKQEEGRGVINQEDNTGQNREEQKDSKDSLQPIATPTESNVAAQKGVVNDTQPQMPASTVDKTAAQPKTKRPLIGIAVSVIIALGLAGYLIKRKNSK